MDKCSSWPDSVASLVVKLPLWLPPLVRARMPCYTLTEPLLLKTAFKTVFAARPARTDFSSVPSLTKVPPEKRRADESGGKP